MDHVFYLQSQVLETRIRSDLLFNVMLSQSLIVLIHQLEYCVQGFDINLEEARLLLGKSKSTADIHDLLGGVGGAVVSPEALRALAEGFEVRTGLKHTAFTLDDYIFIQPMQGNIIPAMGEGDDVDNVLQEELLDSYDSEQVRQMIVDTFWPALQKLAGDAPSLDVAKFNDFVKATLSKCLLDSDSRLNPCLDMLRESFDTSSNSGQEEGMKLLASLVACSIPAALKASSAQGSSIDKSDFIAQLDLSLVDSVKCLLEENGIKSKESCQTIMTLCS